MHSLLISFQVFDALLRACPESKKALISWLVECFERNTDRGKVNLDALCILVMIHVGSTSLPPFLPPSPSPNHPPTDDVQI